MSVECSDGVFRERSGVLSSVDFPSPYPKSSECLYRIEVEVGFRLRLQFDARFDVEDHPDVSCPYDHVKVTPTHTHTRTHTHAHTHTRSRVSVCHTLTDGGAVFNCLLLTRKHSHEIKITHS